MKRIFLFLATNFAILIILSITLNLLGLTSWMTQEGIDYKTLFLFSLVIGFAGSFFSLAISRWMAKRIYSIKVIARPQGRTEEWLYSTIQAQAQKAKIPMPEVGIYQSPEANAFATGPSKKRSLVAVSSGLIERMTSEEVEGVLAHEIAHIANGDMVTMTLLQGVMNTFVVFFSRIIGNFINRVVFRHEGNGPGFGYIISVIVCEIFLGALASMVVFAYSRRREFSADEDAARLWGRDAIMHALQRLKRISESDGFVEDDRSASIAAFKISGRNSKWLQLLTTHPPLEKRIEALRQMKI